MKRICKNIVISTHLFDHPDLSVSEKWVLIAIDSVSDSNGAVIGTQAISSLTGMPSKEVKGVLKSLQSKGALDVRIDEDGAKRLFVYLWKERYIENPNAVVLGDKPSDIQVLPYNEIAEKWKESCPHLPPIVRWSPQSKNKLRSVMKNAGLNLDMLYKCFRIVGATQFLNGTGEFQASFRWLTSKADNLEKVYTGFYARSYAEKSSYEIIMNGGEVNQKQEEEDFYR